MFILNTFSMSVLRFQRAQFQGLLLMNSFAMNRSLRSLKSDALGAYLRFGCYSNTSRANTKNLKFNTNTIKSGPFQILKENPRTSWNSKALICFSGLEKTVVASTYSDVHYIHRIDL
ncbi:MAG: hypothetical protein KDD62_11235 [Bdellovibrionales bacterium]|nr:hypothetical protein [Bdellovibrionales bacterium]